MDLRLDFFNALNTYTETLTDDDALLVLSHNKKDGDCVTLLAGDWEILSSLFSTKGYVNFENGNKEQFENIKKMILNTAFNICATDDDVRNKFMQEIVNFEHSLCKCNECNHQWNAFDSDHFTFSCCEVCGSDDVNSDFN